MRWVQTHVPLLPLFAIMLFIPGAVLWAVFANRTKSHTLDFFNTVASVSPAAINTAGSAVGTTVVTLLCLGGVIMASALVLEVLRGMQQRGDHPDCWCPVGAAQGCRWRIKSACVCL